MQRAMKSCGVMRGIGVRLTRVIEPRSLHLFDVRDVQDKKVFYHSYSLGVRWSPAGARHDIRIEKEADTQRANDKGRLCGGMLD